MAKNENQPAESRKDIFISYSSKDKPIAEKLRQAVNSLQYTAFFDEDALPGSQGWDREIARNINNCRLVLFYRTDNSVASEWCARELRMAENRKKPIIPVVEQSRQNALPDSEAMQALLVNLQNAFIDGTENPSAIKDNLRKPLENAIGRGRGNFGEMSSVLHDMLRQAAAALNNTLGSEVIRYSYDDSDGAGLYRDFRFGDEKAEFRMICRRRKQPGPFLNSSCKNKKPPCGMYELCHCGDDGKKDVYVIDTSVKYFGENGFLFKNLFESKGIGLPGFDGRRGEFHKCPGAPRESLIYRDVTDFRYYDDNGKKSEAGEFSAVMRLIFKANYFFTELEKQLAGPRERAEKRDRFFDVFQDDEELKKSFSIYREGLAFSLVPPARGESPAGRSELGIYDSIELARPKVIRVLMRGLFSEDPKIELRRYENNRLKQTELPVDQALFEADGEKEPPAKKGKAKAAAAGAKNEFAALMDRLRGAITELNSAGAELRERPGWDGEREIREKLKALIDALSEAHVGDWQVSSDDRKSVFTAIGKYQYARDKADGKPEIVSPLRLKIVMTREERAGFVLFHVDEPRIPTFGFEPEGPAKKSASKSDDAQAGEEAAAPVYFPHVMSENPLENPPGAGLDAFVAKVKESWNKVRTYLESEKPGKAITISARRNKLRDDVFGKHFKHAGSVLTSLDGKTAGNETYGDRIAWSLRMDHRFYRDLSKLAGDPIPFCPFIQFIGPGMRSWSVGWESTREFRALPRPVKHFFWHAALEGTAAADDPGRENGPRMILQIEPNGDSVFFNQEGHCFPPKKNDPNGVVDAALKKLEEQKKSIAALWQCISDPDSFEDRKVEVRVEKKKAAPVPPAEAAAENTEDEDVPAAETAAVSEKPADAIHHEEEKR